MFDANEDTVCGAPAVPLTLVEVTTPSFVGADVGDNVGLAEGLDVCLTEG